MRVFIDTNVMLDLLAKRAPFSEAAAQIASLADAQKVTLYVSALSFSTVNYFLSKDVGGKRAKTQLTRFKVISEICPLDETIIDKGLSSDFSDFEDALQYFSALRADCEMIITRNGKDFKESQIPVMTPDEFLKGFF